MDTTDKQSMIILISADERKFLRDAGDRLPLGNLYLSAVLKSEGIEHKVIDLNHDDWEKVKAEIKREQPEMVGLSVMSPVYKQMQEIARQIKKISPYTKIVAGGFHVTSMPGSMNVDEEIMGYAERAILRARKGKNGGKINWVDINEYPIPNRDAVDASRYKMRLEGLKATTMITSRGCPFNCCFCGNFDKIQKRRHMANIEQELREIVSMGYKAVYLLDDSFTLNKAHAEIVARLMRKYNLKYRIETRANLLDEGLVKILAETGCLVVGIGIESGSDRILENICKGETTEQIRKAVKLLGKYGIKTKGFFMFGLPGEDENDAYETIKFAKELKTYGMAYADFYILMPFPGTPIFKDPDKYGIKIIEKDFTKYLVAGKDKPKCFHRNGLMTRRKVEEIRNYAEEEWKR